jgi:hypothetical protein
MLPLIILPPLEPRYSEWITVSQSTILLSFGTNYAILNPVPRSWRFLPRRASSLQESSKGLRDGSSRRGRLQLYL